MASVDFNRLPSSQRAEAAGAMYAKAVELYATTDYTIRRVAKMCGVSAAGLSAHICKHHRPLLFARYGIDRDDEALQSLKVKSPKGQSHAAHIKYREAIQACTDIAYIEYNVSQVARLFGLDGTALASQLKTHFPSVIPDRERIRQRLGLADNTRRGPQQASIDEYAEALALYRDSNLTIAEVAEKCNVSKSGFCQYLRFYHRDIAELKSECRKSARKKCGSRTPGTLAGNGSLYGPKTATVEQYASALELYRNSSLTVQQIIDATGVPSSGFRGYLHQWSRGDKLRRRGYEWDGMGEPDLQGTKKFRKSTAAKYAPAIENLKDSPRPVAEVAAEYGHNPEVFRKYLKAHEPDLFAKCGMARRADGKLVKRSATEKYAQAIREYATTAEPLKDIARRHGLVYNSILGYVMRNCRAERESHLRVVNATIKHAPFQQVHQR